MLQWQFAELLNLRNGFISIKWCWKLLAFFTFLLYSSPKINVHEEDFTEHENGASVIADPEVSNQKTKEAISYEVDPADVADGFF